MVKYLITTVLTLLMLTLFDSNPWWTVVLVSLVATTFNVKLASIMDATTLSPIFKALLQGCVVAVIAYLFGLTSFFRTTFGTLVGLVLLLTLGEYFRSKLTFQANK